MNDSNHPELPPMIRTGSAGASVALALATRRDLEWYVSAMELGAANYASELSASLPKKENLVDARSLWRPGDMPDKKLAAVWERSGLPGVLDAATALKTRVDVDRQIRTVSRRIESLTTGLAHLNMQAIAGRRALSLFRAGDPTHMTYAQACGRPGQTESPATIVNVAAPKVTVENIMPARGPQIIEATKQADGTLRAEIRPLEGAAA